LEVAKSKSIFTVSLTGASGGLMKNIADCAICIPTDETPRIQECHILTGHIICEIAELALIEDLGDLTEKDHVAVASAQRVQQIK
jgi:D-glycero-D-manno-heptose 1,7-bisphosphate phosphatase